MALIKNRHLGNQIELKIDLLKNESLYYEPEAEDYLNWFPIDFSVQVEEEIYMFKYPPTFSLEGLKLFLKTIDSLVEEKKRRPNLSLEEKYTEFECGATEGEFSMKLMNTVDQFEKDIVTTELWINAAYMDGNHPGYYRGFKFWVFLEDIAQFTQELKQQLYELTNGNVDILGR
ncbi:WapI family immunity protein [Enterococcus sp. LJL51]|uniref:WapI family immunity protein n=1 Tax=Enterococcus sp. LJL51 TaxID=3416656 RepID=UPI003CF15C34